MLKNIIMSRLGKIKTQDNNSLIEVTTNATTIGELKAELISEVDFSGKKIIERNLRVSYDTDDALLPEGEFFLFLFPEKIKAGGAKRGPYKPRANKNTNQDNSEQPNIRRIPLVTQETIAAKIEAVRTNIDEILNDFVEDMNNELDLLGNTATNIQESSLDDLTESAAIINEYESMRRLRD